MKQFSVTAIVLTKNEQAMLEGCLKTLGWCSDLLVIDSGSTDETVEIASSFGAKVIVDTNSSFSMRRSVALKYVKTDWLIYIDADERVTPDLARELSSIVQNGTFQVASIPRLNYFFGEPMLAGGWQDEYITRFFKRDAIKDWQGSIHESPIFDGRVMQCQQYIWHFSHRNVQDGLLKSASWTPEEAKLLANAHINRVKPLTVFRKGLGEFIRRGIIQKAWRDGEAGVMEAIIQAINRMLVYIQVWELQRNPDSKKRYEALEQEITRLWKES